MIGAHKLPEGLHQLRPQCGDRRNPIAETTVEQPISGYAHTHREEGLRHTIWGHPFLKVPARPFGEQVTIRGQLDPEPMTVYRFGSVTLNDDIPAPRVTDMRIWVAP